MQIDQIVVHPAAKFQQLNLAIVVQEEETNSQLLQTELAVE